MAQISLGICPVWSESSLSALRKLGSLATHWAQAHSHFVGFVMSQLKLFLIMFLMGNDRKYISWKFLIQSIRMEVKQCRPRSDCRLKEQSDKGLYFCQSDCRFGHRTVYGPRQANLVLIAYVSSEGAGSPEPSLLAYTSSESRGTFRQKARSLAPLNGWACAVKICHDGMLEDTNSLDGAQMVHLKPYCSKFGEIKSIFGGCPNFLDF